MYHFVVIASICMPGTLEIPCLSLRTCIARYPTRIDIKGRIAFEEDYYLQILYLVAVMPILTTLLHISNFKNPFLRTLVPSIGLAYGIQAAVAIPSIIAQSERFYDLSGSLTYISCTALSLFLPAIRARAAARATGLPLPAFPSLLSAFNGTAGPLGFNWRQVVLSAAVTVWATRCKSLNS